MLVFLFLALFSNPTGGKPRSKPPQLDSDGFCLSWRVAVEADNVRAWGTVPTQCLRYIEIYMIGGQYERDVDLIDGQMLSYLHGIVPSGHGMDAWILDVDESCITNVFYCKAQRYGCDPYDPSEFKTWAMTGGCPAIPAMLELFRKLVDSGFKVFMVTGRDEETLGQVTMENLHKQGSVGYDL